MRTEQNGPRVKHSMAAIQNMILRSMDNLSRPLSRAFLADSGIATIYMTTQAVKALVKRGLIEVVTPEGAPENSVWFALTAEGHNTARQLNYADDLHPEISMARAFFNMTHNREGMYAARK